MAPLRVSFHPFFIEFWSECGYTALNQKRLYIADHNKCLLNKGLKSSFITFTKGRLYNNNMKVE